MFEQIEAAIESYLKTEGTSLLPDIFDKVSIEEIDPHKLDRWTRGQVINAYATGGTHTADNYEVRQQLDIAVLIVAEDPKKITERRAKAAKLVQGVISLLTYQQLGLEIQPLMPARWQEITSPELSQIGIMAWQINFTTEYSIITLPEEPETTLMGIDVTYTDGLDGELGSDIISLGEETKVLLRANLRPYSRNFCHKQSKVYPSQPPLPLEMPSAGTCPAAGNNSQKGRFAKLAAEIDAVELTDEVQKSLDAFFGDENGL